MPEGILNFGQFAMCVHSVPCVVFEMGEAGRYHLLNPRSLWGIMGYIYFSTLLSQENLPSRSVEDEMRLVNSRVTIFAIKREA